MKKAKQAAFIFFTSLVFLSACSSTQTAYLQNVELYFSSKVDNTMSSEDIALAPYDLVYVKNGERPIATMALAFIENGDYKWLSSDNAMLITRNGRIIRTLGFTQNLIHTTNLDEDPINAGANIQENHPLWLRRIDSEFNDYGAELKSTFSVTNNTVLSIQGIEFPVQKVQESVAYNSAIYGNSSWVNTFWFHSASNQLIKSSQTISPNLDSIDLTYVSRALRLVGNAAESQDD